MPADRVRTYLMEHGIEYRTHSHPAAYTTSEVAEAEHVPGAQMAKVVLLSADEELVMAVVPGDHRVDLAKARAALGTDEVRLADESDFAGVFPDCETGAEPPFGGLYQVPMVVDQAFGGEQITFNGGTHTETITIGLGDYLDLTRPRRADLSSTH